MVARPRLLLISLATAAVLGVAGGVVWAQVIDEGSGADDEVTLDQPGEYELPTTSVAVAAEGRRLPDVELLDPADVGVNLAGLSGPAVINLWFTTCAPCKRELADFAAVHADVADRVRFIGVDPQDGLEPMLRFAGERGVAYELLRDTDGSFIDALGIVSFPTTIFVDERGVIVAQTGELSEADLRERIEELF